MFPLLKSNYLYTKLNLPLVVHSSKIYMFMHAYTQSHTSKIDCMRIPIVYFVRNHVL